MINFNKAIDSPRDRTDKLFSPHFYYQEHFHTVPDICITTNKAVYNYKKLIDYFLEKFKDDETKMYEYVQFYDTNKKSLVKEKMIIIPKKELLFFITCPEAESLEYPDDDYYPDDINDNEYTKIQKLKRLSEEISSGETIYVIDCYCSKNAKEFALEFLNEITSKIANTPKKKNSLNIIGQNEFGFFLQEFFVKKLDIDINLNYNEDFKSINENIIERLNKNEDKGIVLLSGTPGTGKSTYLRLLTNSVVSKKLIYIPPEMGSSISNPEFITFLMKHQNSILIIEDAETILKSRKSGGNQSVSNLLNLSDGLLGDCLKLQILCTFNCPYQDIDEALRRPGRLIAHYEFKKLELDKTRTLFKKIHIDQGFEPNHAMTLAEIYNYYDLKHDGSNKQTSIGFKK